MDHAPEMHGHSHGHAHDHDHHHHGGSDYYLQQLLTIFICAAFGVVGLIMCLQPIMEQAKDESGNLMKDSQGTVLMRQAINEKSGEPLNKLGLLLSSGFHPWVLVGSVVLLAITLIRGVALWKSVGANQHAHHGHDHAHHHDHKPGEACDHPSHAHEHHGHDHKPGEQCDHPSHAHPHHGHDHDHGDHSADDHSHGNIYWRVVVLLFPVVIFLMGLPDQTFSPEYQAARVRGSEVSGDLADVASKEGGGEVSFETLAGAAYTEQNRSDFTGKTVTVKGQFKPLSATQFTLFFFKETCCAADQVPLKATCVVKKEDETMLKETVKKMVNGKEEYTLVDRPNGQKVTVTGRVQFTQDPNNPNEWLTVLRVEKGGLKKR